MEKTFEELKKEFIEKFDQDDSDIHNELVDDLSYLLKVYQHTPPPTGTHETSVLLLQDALNQQKQQLKDAENLKPFKEPRQDSVRVNAIKNLKGFIAELEDAINILQSHTPPPGMEGVMRRVEALPTYESYEKDKVINRDAVLEIIRATPVIKAKIWKSIATGHNLTTDCKMLNDLDYYDEQPDYINRSAIPFEIEILLPE